MVIKKSHTIWNALKGIICVYKPAEDSVRRIRCELIHKLVTELNSIDSQLRFPEIRLSIEGRSTATEGRDLALDGESFAIDSSSPKQLTAMNTLNLTKDISKHAAVAGPKYIQEAFAVSWCNFLGWNSSGVLLFGLRSGTEVARYIRENYPIRAYRITCVLGHATENGFASGKVVERSTWRYIKQHHMQQMLSSMQAAHQRKMFEQSGIDIQSQEAYELAVKGPIRPADSKLPIIYGLRCIEFKGPEFTLEVHCVNEYETYLAMLVHDIGVKLHSAAHVTSIKCIRHSCFALEHALLPKHFNLQNIVRNLALCGELVQKNMHLLDQENVDLQQYSSME